VSIVEIGPVGNAILEENTDSWTPSYRIRKEDAATQWGKYENLFSLDGKVYISPYWTDGGNWLELDAVEAIGYVAITEEKLT
jgi:hypothetical protein